MKNENYITRHLDSRLLILVDCDIIGTDIQSGIQLSIDIMTARRSFMNNITDIPQNRERY
jgi:hypothetical protein